MFTFKERDNMNSDLNYTMYVGNKKIVLPPTLPIQDSSLKKCFYQVIDYREPKKGEWFISGAIPTLYKTHNDLSTKYVIPIPTYFSKTIQIEVKGEKYEKRKR